MDDINEPPQAAPGRPYIGPAVVTTTRGEIQVTAELFARPASPVPAGGGAPGGGPGGPGGFGEPGGPGGSAGGGTGAEPSWSGQLEAPPGVNLFAVATSPCVLRLPDGREGTVVPGAVTVGTGVIPVTGRGPAPFGPR